MGESNFAEGYAIGRDSGSGNNNGWGGDNAWWIVILLIFGWGGLGNWGNGSFGGNAGASGALTRADLCQDMNFQNLENGVRGIQQGLCDGFYAQNTTMLQGFNGLQNSMNQGFNGLNTALVGNGYENRLAINGLSAQLAECCCETQKAIQANTTQGVMNTSAIQGQIKDCCCDIEKMNLQNRYESAQNQCATLQAIDNVGDKIINYLNAQQYQNMRDENQALRLAASQAAQNQYLVSQLRPTAVPSYTVPNPYTGVCGYTGYGNNNCGCCNGGNYYNNVA